MPGPLARLFGSFIFLGFVLQGLCGSAWAYEDGDALPPLTLMTAGGEKIDVLGYAKKQHRRNLLLVFFRTGTCGYCTSQLVDFGNNLQAIADFKTAVLALSLDDAIVQNRTAELIDHKFPLLMDPEAKTVQAFGIFNPDDHLSRPALFLVGPDHRILYHYVGKSIQDRPPLKKVLEILSQHSKPASRNHP